MDFKIDILGEFMSDKTNASDKTKSKKADFLIDLPMVFSVVSIEDLVDTANKFYGRNIILPKTGGRFDSATERGEVHEFHLYKLTINKLSDDERAFKKNVGGFETLMEKVGVFTNLYDIMVKTDKVTIFSNLEEADVFLRAWLKSHSDLNTKSAYIYKDTEIEGLDQYLGK